MKRRGSSAAPLPPNIAELPVKTTHVSRSVEKQILENFRIFPAGSATCSVSCGFFGFFKCAPLTCEAANPNGCTATTTASGCDVGWTSLPEGTKCFKVYVPCLTK